MIKQRELTYGSEKVVLEINTSRPGWVKYSDSRGEYAETFSTFVYNLVVKGGEENGGPCDARAS